MSIQTEKCDDFIYFCVRKEPEVCVQSSSASECTGWFVGNVDRQTDVLRLAARYVETRAGTHLWDYATWWGVKAALLWHAVVSLRVGREGSVNTSACTVFRKHKLTNIPALNICKFRLVDFLNWSLNSRENGRNRVCRLNMLLFS